MDMPEYDGVIDKWKVDLIWSRAHLFGFRDHELPDALQEVVIEVLGFQYDPDHSTGAQESTALTAVIDRRLRKMQRSEIRYRTHVERKSRTLDLFSREGVDACGADVRAVVEGLPPRDQQICRMIAAGHTHEAIADSLGCSEATVRRTLRRLRTRFDEIDLRGWVDDE